MNMVLFLTNWPFRTQLFSFLTVSYLLLDPPLPGCCFYHFTKTILEPNKMVPTYCPKTGEVETGGLQIPGQSELYQALIQSGLQSGAVILKKMRLIINNIPRHSLSPCWWAWPHFSPCSPLRNFWALPCLSCCHFLLPCIVSSPRIHPLEMQCSPLSVSIILSSS